MKALRFLILILLGLSLGFFETNVSPFFPTPWNGFLPVLGALTLLVSIGKGREALILACAAGLILDLFLADPAFFALARFPIITALMVALSRTVLTNRSVYASVLLVIAARLADRLWIAGGTLASSLLFQGTIPYRPFVETIRIAAWDVALVTVGFLGVVFFTKRFVMMTGGRLR